MGQGGRGGKKRSRSTSKTNPSLVQDKSALRTVSWGGDDWIVSYQDGTSFMEDLYEKGLKYTRESEININVGDRSVYISDGVNPIHKVTVDSRSTIVSSWVGIEAPSNKPRISLEEYGKQADNIASSIDYTEDIGGSSLGGMGLIRCQYTVVTDTGQESNPSPASDFINGQFFKIGDDGISDERVIKSINVYDLNVPDSPKGVLEHLSYFKIYYQIIRYSDGIDLGNMEFSVQVDIKSKTLETTSTGNDYTISSLKSAGSLISYENDTGFPCKTSAVNAGVLMVGNIRKSASIPGEFEYITPIAINNQNNASYVDAVVKITLDGNKIVGKDDNNIFDQWTNYFKNQGSGIKWNPVSNAIDSDYYSRHIRIYDQDMTSPIMVYVPKSYYGINNEFLDIYVKIPLLKASTTHTLYLCWNSVLKQTKVVGDNPVLDSGLEGIKDDYNKIVADKYDWESNIGVHYGRWVLNTDDVNVAQHRQQVFQERRVPAGGTEILTVPGIDSLGFGDDGSEGYDLVNRANTNCHGEAGKLTDPLVAQTAVYPPASSNMTITVSEDEARNPDDYTAGGESTVLASGELISAESANDGTRVKFTYSQDSGDDLILGQEIIISGSSGDFGAGDYNGTHIIVDLADDTFTIEKTYTGAIGSEATWLSKSLLGEFVELSEEIANRYWIAQWAYHSLDGESGINGTGQSVAAIVGLLPARDVQYSGLWRFRSDKLDSEGMIIGNESIHKDELTSSKIRGIIGGLNPLSKAGTDWGFGDNYLLDSDIPYTSLPSTIDRILSVRASGLNKPMPLLSEEAVVNNRLNDDISEDINNFHTIGAFKPWCSGWSFRKTAVNIGKMPNKGYLYTNVCFKLDDLVSSDYGGASLKQGMFSKQTENRYYNTIFYVSCGVINDVEATPNTLLSQNPYPKDTEWTKDGSAYNNTYQVADVRYNADNFRPTSESGADPGTITLDSDNMPENGNSRDITVDRNYSTNTDPLSNMFLVRINKRTASNGDIGYILSLVTQTVEGHNGDCAIEILEFKNDITHEFKNLFIYLTWDIPSETFMLGYSLLEENSRVKTVSKDFSPTYYKISESFENKTLYDIGLGNSTYMNRVVSGTNRHKEFNFSGFHGFYGATEMSTGEYITDYQTLVSLRDGLTRFSEPVGSKYNDDGTVENNQNIKFEDTIQHVDKAYENMLMWSEVGKEGLPDLNYKLTKEPIIKILSAPSFLKLEYSNTFIIFTRNTINRFVLKGTASGWAGSAESLIEENTAYGLYAPNTLAKVGAEMMWLSEVGVIRWSTDGFLNISQNVINIPVNNSFYGFHCPTRNQYILHDNSTQITYVYDLSYRMWTTFEGLDIISSSIMTGGSQLENVNILLSSDGKVNRYPGSYKTTEDAHIRTMDMFMDSGQIRRVKLNYGGTDKAKLVYNLAYTDSKSKEINKIKEISDIEKNIWRGLGEIGMIYGRVASFEVHDADEINTILYDAMSRGGE